jgi:hypothetical protein
VRSNSFTPSHRSPSVGQSSLSRSLGLITGSSSDPVDQGDGEDWDTVGGPAERSRSPAPTVEKLVSRMT